MNYLGVDLASRCSSYVLLDSAGKVQAQGDSYGISEKDFVSRLIQYGKLEEKSATETIVTIEDLPHRIPYRISVKEVCRLQGRIVQQADSYGTLPRIMFVQPAVWQRSFEGVWKGGANGARNAAEELNFFAPDLVGDGSHVPFHNLKGKERTKLRNTAKKLMTDYNDAFLLAYWAKKTWEEHGTLMIGAVQQYHTGV